MLKRIIVIALAGIAAALSFGAAAQSGATAPDSAYAVEACKSGCFAVKERAAPIYSGAVPSSYRICARGAFAVEISVDGTIVRLPNRECGDVNGKIIILTAGEVQAGRLPN